MGYLLEVHPAVAERLATLPRALSSRIRQRLKEIAAGPGPGAESATPRQHRGAEELPTLQRFDLDGWSVLYRFARRTRRVELWAVLQECFETS